MQKLILFPLIGMEVEDVGRILFGQSKEDIKKMLGEPDETHEQHLFYFNHEIRIDFKNNEVEFIECISGPYCEKTQPIIYDREVFHVEANELITLLSEKNNGAIDNTEAPCSYSFLETSIGIYREFSQEDIEEYISQMKNDGIYTENKEWLDQDLEKSRYFWSIGIGRKDYYK